MSYLDEILPKERSLFQSRHLVPLSEDEEGLHVAISEEQYAQRNDLLEADVPIIWHSFAKVDMDALLVAAYGVHDLKDEDLMAVQNIVLTPATLAQITAQNERTGEPVLDILLSQNLIAPARWASLRAEYYGIETWNADFDPELRNVLAPREAIQRRLAPIEVDTKGVVILATDQLIPNMEGLVGTYETRFVSTQLLDQGLSLLYSRDYVHLSTHDLAETKPNISAHQVLSGGQKVFFTLALLAIVFLLVWYTKIVAIVLIAICSVIYVLTGAYRLKLLFTSLGEPQELAVSAEALAKCDENILPIYTILIPLYKEASVVKRLVNGLSHLDYPASRLDIKLLCEEDDVETQEAIRKLSLPSQYSLVIVPDGQPKTKPKACNYGLLQARGKYVVIYDAEDQPDPQQLKKAALLFEKLDDNVICIQAKLNYFNAEQNLLTRLFSVEYSMHFDLLLPGLHAEKSPIPLGGTSNHFRADKLRELGGWDPYNVTEDADLGVRLAREGYSTSVMDSTTLEEANSQVPNWIRQRSRWIKGYIQTYLVHMRHPFSLWNELGTKNFISFNLVFGIAFVFLINPIFWTLTTLFILTQNDFIHTLFPPFIYYAAAIMLVLGNFLFVYINIIGSARHGAFSLVRFALLSPIYWGLISYAAWKGFLQLFTNPFYWEKTVHGLDEAGEN